MPVESDAELREILGLQNVAVVGCSSTPGKDAHEVPEYLLENGYDVIPVNPTADEIFDRRAYDSLGDVEETVDLVNVFRPSEEVADIVDAAVDRDDVCVIWTQLGVRDDEAARRAEAADKKVVQDRCIRTEHQQLVG